MKFPIALLLLSLIFISCGDDTPDVTEEDAIRNTFSHYKKAITAGSGAEALQWVDSTTVAYYGRILGLAKTGDSASVQALDLQDRYMVLLIRHSIPGEQVLTMDAAALFTYAVSKGMLGESGVGDMEIGDVKVNGNDAMGSLTVKGQPSGLDFHFRKEGALWKINLTSLFPAAKAAFQNLAAQSGKSEDSVIIEMLEFQSEKKPGPEIWVPADSANVR